MSSYIQVVLEARTEAKMWRGLAWIMSEALVKWDDMTEDDKAKTLAGIAELTPGVLQLPWEEATPDGQAPQWALDLLAASKEAVPSGDGTVLNGINAMGEDIGLYIDPEKKNPPCVVWPSMSTCGDTSFYTKTVAQAHALYTAMLKITDIDVD